MGWRQVGWCVCAQKNPAPLACRTPGLTDGVKDRERDGRRCLRQVLAGRAGALRARWGEAPASPVAASWGAAQTSPVGEEDMPPAGPGRTGSLQRERDSRAACPPGKGRRRQIESERERDSRAACPPGKGRRRQEGCA